MAEISPRHIVILLFPHGSGFQWGQATRLEDLHPGDYFLLWDGTCNHGSYHAESTAWRENVPLCEGRFMRPFDASRDWTWVINAKQITEPGVVAHDLMAMDFAELEAYLDRVLAVKEY